jgi:hypothetical protein
MNNINGFNGIDKDSEGIIIQSQTAGTNITNLPSEEEQQQQQQEQQQQQQQKSSSGNGSHSTLRVEGLSHYWSIVVTSCYSFLVVLCFA